MFIAAAFFALAVLVFVWRATKPDAKPWQVTFALLALLGAIGGMCLYRRQPPEPPGTRDLPLTADERPPPHRPPRAHSTKGHRADERAWHLGIDIDGPAPD